MNELLAAADKVTVAQAIDIAFNPQVYRAEKWQARVKEAWSNAPRVGQDRRRGRGLPDRSRAGTVAATPTPTGALAYYAFKRALGKELGSKVEPPAELKDEPDRRGPAPGRRVAAVQLRLGRGPVRPLLPRGSRGGRSVLAGRRRLAERSGDGHAARDQLRPVTRRQDR